MLKNLIAPGIALVLTLITGAIAFSVDNSIADHDTADKAHPTMIIAMKSLESKLDLLEQKQELNQKSNNDAHERSDKAQERILDALVRIDEKL